MDKEIEQFRESLKMILSLLNPEMRQKIIRQTHPDNWDIMGWAIGNMINEPCPIDHDFMQAHRLFAYPICHYGENMDYGLEIMLFGSKQIPNIAMLCINGTHHSQSNLGGLVLKDKRTSRLQIICGCCTDRCLPTNFCLLLEEACKKNCIDTVLLHGASFYEHTQGPVPTSIKFIITSYWKERGILLPSEIDSEKFKEKFRNALCIWGFGRWFFA